MKVDHRRTVTPNASPNERNQVERVQQEVSSQRARFNAEQQQQAASRPGGGYYPHLPQQASRGAGAGYMGMGGPPPGYTPPSGNYLGAGGTAAGPWRGGTGGATAVGGVGGYGYTPYGGAQTPYTQRR